MAEELWEIALSRLKESDGDAAAVLLQPDGSVGSGVVGLIEDIERKRRAREEEGGWTVTLPGTRRDGKKRVLSVRRAVYSILEAAFEYKDIVDKVLAFDPTRYGKFSHPLQPVYQKEVLTCFRGYCVVCRFLWNKCEDTNFISTVLTRPIHRLTELQSTLDGFERQTPLRRGL